MTTLKWIFRDNRCLVAVAFVSVVGLAFVFAGPAFADEPDPYSGSDSELNAESVEPVDETAENGNVSTEIDDEPMPEDSEKAEVEEDAEKADEEEKARKKPPEKAFEGAYMLVGRNVKVPTTSRRFAVGIDLAVAPLNVVGKVAKDKFVDLAFDQVCGSSGNPALCRESIETAVDYLSSVSTDDWQDIRTAAGGDKAALMAALEAAGVPDSGIRDQIADVVYSYADGVAGPDERMQAVDAIRAGASSSAMNLLFNPYLYMNFKWVEATIYAPFAIRTTDEGTEADMANISADVKSGKDWTFGKIASIAVAGGLELYLPSGTSGISQSRGSDVFSVPKYTYGMLTWAPYLVFGVEFVRILQLQAHLELVSMHGVLSGAEHDLVMYMKWGSGFVLLPRFVVSILFEVNGCKGLKNATWDQTIMAAAGLNLRLKFFKLFFGVQVPLVDQGRYVWDSGYWTGANYDQLSSFNVMSRFGFEF